MGVIDRYVIRQVLKPLAIGVLVFTFVFIIDVLREYVEPLVARGVDTPTLVTVIATLVPQALALSIPMSLLLGLLVAFGRLSSDREFVAMQACGVSLRRLLRPVAVVSLVCWAATSYVMLVAVPESNQLFREVAFRVVANRAEGEVKPRVFFDDFPNLVLYARDVPVDGGGWYGVFMSDTRPGRQAAVYLAQRGEIRVDRAARTVEVVLYDGAFHTHQEDGYEMQVQRFERFVSSVDPATVFPSAGPVKGDREMSVAELRELIAERKALGESTHNQIMAIQQKFAIPVACLVFGIIGLALGATNRRDGALGSFGLGLAVVFAYYIPFSLSPQMTKGGFIPPGLAPWMPNIILGIVAVALLAWRNRAADQPIRLPIPARVRRLGSWLSLHGVRPAAGLSRVPLVDRYVGGLYLRLLVVTAAAALSVFYISNFIDLSDKLFKGDATLPMLGRYFWYATAQFLYYVLPIAVLLAALVTVGMLTRTSELVVMKACGISLYRVAAPMLACGAAVGGVLFLMDATVLGTANREADALKDVMRGGSAIRPIYQPWIAGTDGTIYHVRGYDPADDRFLGIDEFEYDAAASVMRRWTYAARAVHSGADEDRTWRLEDGWRREFVNGFPDAYDVFDTTAAELEPASYFVQEPPDARFMSYAELQRHSEQLRQRGFDVMEHEVGLARKIAYPFVTLIMTLIAIPFAVTMGRSGAMAGLAAGIGLAIAYWGTINISAALGAGGALSPALAAWAPNLVFGAGAIYLLLTVRT